MSALSIPAFDAAEIARLPQRARDQLNFWRVTLRSVVESAGKKTQVIREVAQRNGIPPKTLERKYYQWVKAGQDWRVIIDRRLAPELQHPTLKVQLPAAFVEHWKGIQQRYQRRTGMRAAWRALIRAWQAGEQIPGYENSPTAEAMTGIPRGWSYSNLAHYHKLTRYESVVSRVGRGAARAMLPKVLTTRVNVLPGQVFILDDQDYDVSIAFVGINRKLTRPSGFNALDLSTACDIMRGCKPTILNADGSKQKLKQVDFEWFVVGLLTTIGYRADVGTLLIGEHGTSKAGKDFLARVEEATDGMVKWDASGIHGQQLCGLFRGQPRGNPQYKAQRESWFNLLRNEMAALPGPTGRDRANAPEENYELDIYTRKILDVAAARPELANRLKLPVLRWSDFIFVVNAISEIINARTDHELEGWEQMERVVGEWRLTHDAPWLPASSYLAMDAARRGIAEALIHSTPGLWKTRKLSPAEAWKPAVAGLTRVSCAAVPVLLGPSAARELRVSNDHHIFVEDSEIWPEPMVFDSALSNGTILEQGRTLLCYLNPYLPNELQVCDDSGRWIGVAERVHRIDKLDTEALRRRYGQVKKIEGLLNRKVNARRADIIRERIEMHRNNAEVLAGGKVKPSRLPDAEDLASATEREAPSIEISFDSDLEGAAAEMTNLFSNP